MIDIAEIVEIATSIIIVLGLAGFGVHAYLVDRRSKKESAEIHELMKDDPTGEIPLPEQAARARLPEPFKRGEKVLFLDDDGTNLKTWKNIFGDPELYGFKVEVAASGLDAIKQLVKGDIGILVIDMKLHDEDGIDLCERFKKEFPMVARVMFSAYWTPDTLMEAVNRGGVSWVSKKPFNNDEMAKQIRKNLQDRRAQVPRISQILKVVPSAR